MLTCSPFLIVLASLGRKSLRDPIQGAQSALIGSLRNEVSFPSGYDHRNSNLNISWSRSKCRSNGFVKRVLLSIQKYRLKDDVDQKLTEAGAWSCINSWWSNASQTARLITEKIFKPSTGDLACLLAVSRLSGQLAPWMIAPMLRSACWHISAVLRQWRLFQKMYSYVSKLTPKTKRLFR